MKRYGRKSGKRWGAKLRREKDRAVRHGAPAAVCPQCDSIQVIRAPEYDGPLCVTRGRCTVCGTPIVLHDVIALLRADLHRPRPQAHGIDAQRLVSTDFDILVFDEKTGEVIRDS